MSLASTAKFTRCGGAKFIYTTLRSAFEVRTMTSLPPTIQQINCAKHKQKIVNSLLNVSNSHNRNYNVLFY